MKLRTYGFTLLEVLISIAILAFISIYTATAIQNSIRSKKKYEKEIDRRSQLRSALDLISRDINLAFNHRDLGADLYNLAFESRIKAAEEQERRPNQGSGGGAPIDGQTQPPPIGDQGAGQTLSQQLRQKFKRREQRILTHFLGSGDRLDFTSIGFQRKQADSKASDQMEVGYFLKDCKSRLDPKETTKCLFRRVSSVLDGKVDEGGTETVLLENTTQFILRYTGEGYEGEWTDQWKTDDQASDARTKDKFPFAVEVTLGIKEPEKPDSKGLSMTVVAQIRFPNNPAPTAPAQGGASTNAPATAAPPPADTGSGGN